MGGYDKSIIECTFSSHLKVTGMTMQTVTEENHSLSSIEPLKNDTFQIGSRTFSSRLLVGTGKYKDLQQTGEAIEASGAEIVTVAIRRTNIGQHSDQPNLLDVISPEKYTILPNTAGCFDADTAIRTCQLARELLDGHNLVKLEVLGDQETLYPNVTQTLIAAQKLIDDGFEVMVYTSDDPIVAKELASMGCVAIMPLGSLIGSGLGLLNPHNLSLIIENTKAQNIPVLVDAGVGAASDAAIAMELGCDGVLMNSAIAHASNPVLMAHAMKHAIWAGRASYIAGRMPKRKMAVPSSPQTGYFFQ
ncbi:thiazole biosynthesis protein ThiG [Psychrobacter sp. 1501(2011)]|nr:thiazole biosynthesis protein ThiG [Psychrobacter sp. 1501(2011)]